MARILALGTGPLLEGGVQNFNAHGLRTWHLVKPLLDAGHQVHLFTVPISTDKPETMEQAGCIARTFGDFSYRAFLNGDPGCILRTLAETCESLKPDCLLGINSYPCYAISQLPCSIPLWCDLNGAVVAEGELKERVYGNNLLLGYYWAVEEAALIRADRFSVVSRRQLYSLMGELGAVGRLNRHTATYDFAVHIPNACHPMFADPPPPSEPMRGSVFPRDAFAVVWSGTYNAWTDVEMLFRAIEAALAACPDMHYVSTGGAVFGHDDLTYERFESLVATSAHKHRYHLLGWIQAERLPILYRDADLGLCVESRNHETLLGARNRTINMMAAGLPILTTRGAEISVEIVEAGCALGCELDSVEDLADALIRAWRERKGLEELARRGRHYVLEKFDYERTTAPLVQWAEQPTSAPDNAFKIRLAAPGEDPFSIPTNPIEQRRLHRRDMQSLPPRPGIRSLLKQLGKEVASRIARSCCHAGRTQSPDSNGVVLSIDFSGSGPPAGSGEDHVKLAATSNSVERITFQFDGLDDLRNRREMIALMIIQARARHIELIAEGEHPEKLQALCAWLLEERKIPGRLEAWVRLDGLKETHNRLRANPRAWLLANHALHLLAEVKRQWPDRFEFGALTAPRDRTGRELTELAAHLSQIPGCRQRIDKRSLSESKP